MCWFAWHLIWQHSLINKSSVQAQKPTIMMLLIIVEQCKTASLFIWDSERVLCLVHPYLHQLICITDGWMSLPKTKCEIKLKNTISMTVCQRLVSLLHRRYWRKPVLSQAGSAEWTTVNIKLFLTQSLTVLHKWLEPSHDIYTAAFLINNHQRCGCND